MHPPGGKLLLGLVGKSPHSSLEPSLEDHSRPCAILFAAYLAGFDGEFMFDSGITYPKDVPYVPIRAFCALFGALLVPVTFMTIINMRCSYIAATVGAIMVLLGEF